MLLGALGGAWVGLIEADLAIDGLFFGLPDASRLGLGWPGCLALWAAGAVHGAAWGAVVAGAVGISRGWRARMKASGAIAGACGGLFPVVACLGADPRAFGNPWIGAIGGLGVAFLFAALLTGIATRGRYGERALALGAALFLAWRAVPVVASARPVVGAPPDVVLVTLASARADRFGAPTPKLAGFERLTREGVWFQSAVTTGLDDADVLRTLVGPAVRAAHAQGYRTGAFLGGSVADALSDAPFDVYENDHDFVLGLDTIAPGRLASAVLPGFFRAAVERHARPTLDRALRWFGTDPRPAFLWIHLQDAAAPYQPPPPFDERFTHGGDPRDPANSSLRGVALPGWLAGVTDRGWVAARYDGEVAYADAELARFLEALAARVRPSGSAVALVGVTGESLGEDGEFFSHGRTASLAAVHVPMVLRVPGATGGVVEGAPVTTTDLARTLVAQTGAAWAPADGEAYELGAVVAKTGPARQSACVLDPGGVGGGCMVPGWFYRVTGGEERVLPVPRVGPSPWTRARLLDLRGRLGGANTTPEAEVDLLRQLGYQSP